MKGNYLIEDAIILYGNIEVFKMFPEKYAKFKKLSLIECRNKIYNKRI